MKIIYHCYGGAHSSVTAAAIHLGQLPEDSIPNPKEFYSIGLYDWQTQKNHGNIYHMGTDDFKNEVYVLGRRSMSKVVNNLTNDLVEALNVDKRSIMLVDASKHINIMMRIGGVLSRRFRFVRLGRPLVIRGTIKAYPCLVSLVRDVKIKVGSRK